MYLPETEIPTTKEKPFEHCKLKRQQHAVNLTNIVKNVNQPFVLVLDAKWGDGKTTFIKMWQKHLEKEEIDTIYFNAWENDFYEDPFMAFLGEISQHFKGKKIDGLLKTVRTKAVNIVKNIVSDKINDFTGGTIDLQKKIDEGFVEQELTRYENQKTALREFKTALTTLVQENKKKTPLVFFIDELDRCKPTYSIALLERLKHIFNVEGIFFVLAVDSVQLLKSFKAVYGDIDSQQYFKRFVDITFSFPQADLEDFIKDRLENTVDKFLENTNNAMEVFANKKNTINFFSEFISKNYQPTLRDFEKLFVQVESVVLINPNMNPFILMVYCFALFTKLNNREEYELLKQGKVEPLFDKLIFDRNSDALDPIVKFIQIPVKFFFSSPPEWDKYRLKMRDEIERQNIEIRYVTLKHNSKMILDLVESPSHFG